MATNEDKCCVLLKQLMLNFYSGNLDFTLKSDDVEKMDWSWQKTFLEATTNSDLIKQYPISSQFTKLFLKKLIEYLEPNQEVHDDFYEQLCTSMKDISQEGYNYRHYVIGRNFDKIVTIKETRNMVVNGTTGLKTWEAALMISDWAICHKEIFANKNVLELGSGVGFAGITIGKMCHIKSMLLSDCHKEVLKTINENILINFSDFKRKHSNDLTLYDNGSKSIGVMMLDWFDIEDLKTTITVPDIIIGADIVYDPTILKHLCKVIHTFCKKNSNLEVYIASVVRNEETFKEFLKTLETMKLKWGEIEITKSVFIEWNENIQKCLLKIELRS